ncbi:DUF2790 domain-containing protein [Pseudomonas veronii]|uniref:DUF2790 domain-containing protein n=1 Tax=Pseudomonas veronii TaxID=76761 RepID=UPI002D76CB2F|nr:DUF2790 domain-containing protein [Pseudomonas veronii]WRU61160.1 DUF2790 domain-containing protein [Pseudomonas veronii]
MKNIALAALMITFLASAAHADQPDSNVPHYKYGMHLDIKKVVHVSTLPKGCEPGPVVMDYLDSAGVKHRIQYEEMGEDCPRH